MSNSKIVDIDIQNELLSKPCSAPPSNPGVTIHDRIKASQQMLSSAREEAREVIRRNPFKSMFEREIARRLRVESVEIDVDEEGRVVAILGQSDASPQVDTSGGVSVSSQRSQRTQKMGPAKAETTSAPVSSGDGTDARSNALERLRAMKEDIVASGSSFDMRKLDLNALREIAESVGMDPSEWGRSKSGLWKAIFENLGADPDGDPHVEPKKMIRVGDPSPVSEVEIPLPDPDEEEEAGYSDDPEDVGESDVFDDGHDEDLEDEDPEDEDLEDEDPEDEDLEDEDPEDEDLEDEGLEDEDLEDEDLEDEDLEDEDPEDEDLEDEDPEDEDPEDEDPEDEDPEEVVLTPKSHTERARQGLSLSGMLSRGRVSPNIGENPLSRMPKRTVLNKSKEIDLDALLADDDDEE